MQIKKPMPQAVFLKLSENLRQVVKPTSNKPANIRSNQFMPAKIGSTTFLSQTTFL
jgi:hypothetical protein